MMTLSRSVPMWPSSQSKVGEAVGSSVRGLGGKESGLVGVRVCR